MILSCTLTVAAQRKNCSYRSWFYVESLVGVAQRPPGDISSTCSDRYQTFTSLLWGAAQSKPWNGGLGSAGAVMTTLYWNGSAFAPMNKTAAKKEAALLRLEAAFMGADAIPSHKHRGLMYLRQNGFAATR